MFLPASALAQENTVVIVVDDSPSGLEPRIKAELENIGFSVEIKNVPGTTITYKDLQLISKESDAMAALYCRATRGVVEIWLSDRVTKKVLLREVPIPQDRPDAETVAIFDTVELLRASLLEVHTTHRAVEDSDITGAGEQLIEPRQDEQPDAVPEYKSKRRLFLELAPALLGGNFQTGPGFDIQAGMRVRILEEFSVSLLAISPVVPSRKEEPEGTINTRFGVVGLDAGYSFLRPERRVGLALSGGFSLCYFMISGTPNGDYQGNEETRVTWAPYLRGTLGVDLIESLKLKLDLLSGYTLTEVTVRMAGRPAVSYGQPFWGVGLGLEVTIL